MSNRDIGIRALIPGQRFPDEIKEDENNRRYIETIVNRSAQIRPREEPLGETLMRNTPSLHLELNSKEETKEAPKDLTKVLTDQAKGMEMVRKARQNPEWVAEHNKRFGRISKTTVLPKDKTVAQLQTLKNWGLSKPEASPVQAKKLHQRLGNKSEKWIDNPKKLEAFVKSEDPTKEAKYIPWYDRMAQEEAESLNKIKRSTWEHGGKVNAEPKYVTAQDVKNVYDKK